MGTSVAEGALGLTHANAARGGQDDIDDRRFYEDAERQTPRGNALRVVCNELAARLQFPNPEY
jgi:hypothetical protein